MDSFSKAVGEILKDEGLYKDNGASVHDVITEALQEVRCSLSVPCNIISAHSGLTS